jgi:HD-like signal output (HDOD) protein/signal transduction histidine kinase
MPATAAPKTKANRDAAQIELILSQIDSLPTLPVVAMRLLEITTSPETSTPEVARLIESDQTLAARVLSVTSCAAMGQKADTVQRAVSLLGFNGVRSLVLSIQVFETFSHRQEKHASQFDRVGFWKHSLAVACAARLLAEYAEDKERSHWPKPEEAFVCGLVHDVGKVALDAVFPKTYERVVAAVDASHGNIGDVEQEVFGLDHTAAGRRLAVHWALPGAINECIWLHHHLPASTPSQIEYPDHVRLVQFADRLARHMRVGYSGNYRFEQPLETTAREMGFADEVVDRVTAELPELIESRATMIGLDTLTSKALYQEALAEANVELARVNTSLAQTNHRLEQRAICFDAVRTLTAGLSDEPTHEDVCKAALRAIKILHGEGPVALLGCSERRGITFLAGLTQAAEQVQLDLLPQVSGEDRDRLNELAAAWWPTSMLPASFRDRLGGLAGGSPAWCWPIRQHDRFWGGIVVFGKAPPADGKESYAALSDGIGVWLSNAEAATAAQKLNEELVEMNRRLVASRAEVARMRSLSMIGAMAAGAAHELNNPLAVISGRAQLLKGDAHGEVVQNAADLISKNAHRASEIVSELMEFAKPTPPEPTTWSLCGLLGDLRRTWIEKGVFTEKQFLLYLSDQLPDIRADASQIKKLFDEVIRNAAEAMQQTDSPVLSINCSGHVTDERVVIEVTDNGRGMSAAVLEEALTPFFSHRTAGRGRGLGLSRAARYAEINNARMRLTSRENEGTVVLIELPIVG